MKRAGRRLRGAARRAYGSTDTADLPTCCCRPAAEGKKHGDQFRALHHRRAGGFHRPERARHDWEIVVDFARRLSRKAGPHRRRIAVSYADAEAIFDRHRENSRGQDLGITGLSLPCSKQQGPQQWPYPEERREG
ncbi:MAG: hypothetical protein IPN75_12210 [Dechloromonas sp.]|uniref:Uncharacterized protein n=1 Tax=Candidatus Dechloromonas phosphorivorans TaxID=2899244 RepID=A0A9D7LRX2_9RHOO|nr:hypothetical protein [Candidatus Dechloromonas phosphorivorans]